MRNTNRLIIKTAMIIGAVTSIYGLQHMNNEKASKVDKNDISGTNMKIDVE
jgi:hypothetical protein